MNNIKTMHILQKRDFLNVLFCIVLLKSMFHLVFHVGMFSDVLSLPNMGIFTDYFLCSDACSITGIIDVLFLAYLSVLDSGLQKELVIQLQSLLFIILAMSFKVDHKFLSTKKATSLRFFASPIADDFRTAHRIIKSALISIP